MADIRYYECGYCSGQVMWSNDKFAYVHTDNGERVTASHGDYVSLRHNQAGTTVSPVDVVDPE